MTGPHLTPPPNSPDLPAQDPAGAPAPADWKAGARLAFERWLDQIDSIPEPAPGPEPAEIPDLLQFHQHLAALAADTRKANRRTADAFSQWSATLAQFESELGPLRESVAGLTADPAKASGSHTSDDLCLVLVELLDRLQRIAAAFDSPPPPRSFWPWSGASWESAWQTQQQALAIVIRHFEELLRREGVTRLPSVGEAFDPHRMLAVAYESAPGWSPRTVHAETAAGYLRNGRLLRPAQVKVASA